VPLLGLQKPSLSPLLTPNVGKKPQPGPPLISPEKKKRENITGTVGGGGQEMKGLPEKGASSGGELGVLCGTKRKKKRVSEKTGRKECRKTFQK